MVVQKQISLNTTGHGHMTDITAELSGGEHECNAPPAPGNASSFSLASDRNRRLQGGPEKDSRLLFLPKNRWRMDLRDAIVSGDGRGPT